MQNRQTAPGDIIAMLKDPKVFSTGCVPPHSDHVCTGPGGEALRLGLDGEWAFSYAKTLEEAPDGFHLPGHDVDGWGRIRVPGMMETQGYGAPQYVDNQYPWDGHEALTPPQIPGACNPTGSYVTFFTLPPAFAEGRVRLCFGAAAAALAVWVNGQFAGYHEDSFLPAEFDITGAVVPGENRVAARVYKYCTGSWLEDQDFWRLSGIFRSVELVALPEVHMEDVRVQAQPDADLEKGSLCLAVGLSAADAALLPQAAVQAEVYAPDGALQGSMGLAPQRDGLFCGTLKVESPLLWSAEAPHLYRVVLTARLGEAVLEKTIIKTGFRRFEMKDGLMCLNGKRIVFCGVNRHEFSPVAGRAISRQDMLWDVLCMKQNNINAVRTSHYPNDPYFYSLCDEYGLYVMDEANLETHGTWLMMSKDRADFLLPDDKPEWRGACLARAAAMLERDKNHPSVLIWSCGNESYGGKTLYEMSEYFRQSDPSRLVHYEGISQDRRYPATSDMESRMYHWAKHVEEYVAAQPQKPFILCEYSHAMGNSCGGLFKYTGLAKKYPAYQGGFIWDFIDQAFCGEDGNMLYGGDFDDRPNNRNFCGNGIVYANRTLSPKMQEVKHCYASVDITPKGDKVLLSNRYLFTGLGKYALVWWLERQGTLLQSGCMKADVPPGAQATLPLPVALPEEGGEYLLTVSLRLEADTPWAKAGHELAFGQQVLHVDGPAEEAKPPCDIRVADCDTNIGVRCGAWHAIFCRGPASLVSLRAHGRELMKKAPFPNFWRAPTDNDRGWRMLQKLGVWSTTGTAYDRTPAAVCMEQQDGSVTVTYTYRFGTCPETVCAVQWQARQNGRLACRMEMAPDAALPPLPDFGMLFTLDAAYDRVRYYGLGPAENYCDRQTGARLGVYDYPVAAEPNLRPQECGNRGGTRWVKLANAEGHGLVIHCKAGMDFSVLPYTPKQMEQAAHLFELPPVQNTILRVSAGQMGVGGDDSWGTPVHEEFMLPSGQNYSFEFEIEVALCTKAGQKNVHKNTAAGG